MIQKNAPIVTYYNISLT